MADRFPIGPKRTITTDDDSYTLNLGDAGADNRMGAWHIHFENAADRGSAAFVGSLTVVTRSKLDKAVSDTAIWLPCPFRPVFLNGAGLPDFRPAAAGTRITSTSILLAPCSGGAIGLQVVCSAGSGVLYVVPVFGSAMELA